ncbi:cysteine desulfurase-like protein [bacterium]|nr:cysteine desulfurase-like protein [bacterium]OIO88815.1 MAG: cysteine desulfurase-like protein [Anaerolineae bacterium CG2_30_58_95]PIU91403.1 MAG: cysteine desulfurase-like protein [Anaerolineae bacterium CG06_land_8_20_14_3_00_57_67]PIW18348.1 MAG: cysteine desulfurase-like protein [Anaerolineae bacterium CG17_big_fil_post_rev_8_21_14_2_50_57_27]PIX47367.1 MAG: cysteine desulfurase-like protein [Anaerolineae bacterium CG_4_8_14_3_um_filter_59_70]PIZ25646.1 MAG: cysteine desulfurase-like p
MSLDLASIRKQFPSLGRPAIFFDNPGGTQIAKQSLDRITRYLLECNANHEGAFATSVASDAILDEAHRALADFLNACGPEEIVFGANMTTLTLYISRSISRDWKAGDEIVVTRLDHDANVTPWVLAAQDRGCKVIWVDFHPEDGTLNMEEMQAALARKPRLVAVGYASNSLGTINPVAKIIGMAHAVGALVYVDAVQYAPHGPIDVQKLDCDFLVSSAYKFFGPHAGILYGKRKMLEELFAYKVRPATNELPGKFETGTQNHEGIAGVLGALEYFEWVGREFGREHVEGLAEEGYRGRRMELKKAMTAIRSNEFELSRALLAALQSIPGLTLYGLSDVRLLEQRVPTFSFTLKGQHPRQVAEKLAQNSIYAWDGNYYAIGVTERLGLEEGGGMVRVGAVHYNTLDEVEMLREALTRIAAGRGLQGLFSQNGLDPLKPAPNVLDRGRV